MNRVSAFNRVMIELMSTPILTGKGLRIGARFAALLVFVGLLSTEALAATCDATKEPTCSCPIGTNIVGLRTSSKKIMLKDSGNKTREMSAKTFKAYLGQSGGRVQVVGEKGSRVYFCYQGEVLNGQKLFFRRDAPSVSGDNPGNLKQICLSLSTVTDKHAPIENKYITPRALLNKDQISAYREKCCSSPGLPCPDAQ